MLRSKRGWGIGVREKKRGRKEGGFYLSGPWARVALVRRDGGGDGLIRLREAGGGREAARPRPRTIV